MRHSLPLQKVSVVPSQLKAPSASPSQVVMLSSTRPPPLPPPASREVMRLSLSSTAVRIDEKLALTSLASATVPFEKVVSEPTGPARTASGRQMAAPRATLFRSRRDMDRPP